MGTRRESMSFHKAFPLLVFLGVCAPLGICQAQEDGLTPPPIARTGGVAAARSDIAIAADKAGSDFGHATSEAGTDIKEAGHDLVVGARGARNDFDRGIAEERSDSLAASEHWNRARSDWAVAKEEGRTSRGLFSAAGHALGEFFRDLGGGMKHGARAGEYAGKAGIEAAKSGGDRVEAGADATIGTVKAGADLTVGGVKAAVATGDATVDVAVGTVKAGADLAVGAGRAVGDLSQPAPSSTAPETSSTSGLVGTLR
jgi:hypothetical protein